MRAAIIVTLLAFTAVTASAAGACKSSSSILLYGSADSTWGPWFQANIPNATLTQDSSMSNTLTLQYLSQFDLVIVAQVVNRLISAAESNAALDYLNNGGAIIALSGFTNDEYDRTYQQAIFASLGITYGTQLITLGDQSNSLNYNLNNPLTTGLAGGYVDFVGGWASTPYTGPGTTSIFATGVSIYDFNTYSIGQTIILPSGGKIVTWGDEWATFTSRYNNANNKDAQFWKNAVAWVSNICVPGSQVGPCASSKIEVASACTQTTQSTTGKGFTLSFSNTASLC